MKRILNLLILILTLNIYTYANERIFHSPWEKLKETVHEGKEKLTKKVELEKEKLVKKVESEQEKLVEKIENKKEKLKEKISLKNLKNSAKEKFKESIYTKGGGGLINDTLDIDNAKMEELADIAIKESDSQHIRAGKHNHYRQRIDKLMKKISLLDPLTLDVQVYKSKELNAFSMANGAIRINSSLIDLMDDNELTFIIGHEIGHIINSDSKDSYRVAYAVSRLHSKDEFFLAGMIKNLTSHLVNAKFSRHEESDADVYAIRFVKHNKIKLTSILGALEKLKSQPSSLLSTHPATEERILSLKEAIEKENS